tara:strand:- start:7758 stop:8462 length:705 start_codon:yes stop_codon:yes gene_type:complete
MNKVDKIMEELQDYASEEKAAVYRRFFKTGKGEYGEGDKFIGLTVPEQRKIAQKYVDVSFDDVKKLLKSEIHEHRLTGFFILVYKFEKADESEKKEIAEFYLDNLDRANNWDLIDCVADKILGPYYFEKDISMLYLLARSDNLWERRISIITTFYFIKQNSFEDTLKIAEILLKDKHDLIHKAVGWMLREVGKRDQEVEEEFLKKHYKNMPRTMLRYAIERFSKEKKEFYMKKN